MKSMLLNIGLFLLLIGAIAGGLNGLGLPQFHIPMLGSVTTNSDAASGLSQTLEHSSPTDALSLGWTLLKVGWGMLAGSLLFGGTVYVWMTAIGVSDVIAGFFGTIIELVVLYVVIFGMLNFIRGT